MCSLFSNQDDTFDEYCPYVISKNNTIYTVRSKITSLIIGERRSKIGLAGRKRTYHLPAQSKMKIGDYVELRYQLIPYNSYIQAWIVEIQKITQF